MGRSVYCRFFSAAVQGNNAHASCLRNHRRAIPVSLVSPSATAVFPRLLNGSLGAFRDARAFVGFSRFCTARDHHRHRHHRFDSKHTHTHTHTWREASAPPVNLLISRGLDGYSASKQHLRPTTKSRRCVKIVSCPNFSSLRVRYYPVARQLWLPTAAVTHLLFPSLPFPVPRTFVAAAGACARQKLLALLLRTTRGTTTAVPRQIHRRRGRPLIATKPAPTTVAAPSEDESLPAAFLVLPVVPVLWRDEDLLRSLCSACHSHILWPPPFKMAFLLAFTA